MAMPRHREPRAPSTSIGPSESPGLKALGSRHPGRAGEPAVGAGGGVGKPCRCPTSPAASLLPAHWPVASPARSLWVFINETWYRSRRGQAPNKTWAHRNGFSYRGRLAKKFAFDASFRRLPVSCPGKARVS